MYYAINLTKIYKELEQILETKFENRIKKLLNGILKIVNEGKYY